MGEMRVPDKQFKSIELQAKLQMKLAALLGSTRCSLGSWY